YAVVGGGSDDAAMPGVALSPPQRAELESILRRGKTEVRLHRRASMVLLAASGLTATAIAKKLWTSRYRVGLWLGRYVRGREGASRPPANGQTEDDQLSRTPPRPRRRLPGAARARTGARSLEPRRTL